MDGPHEWYSIVLLASAGLSAIIAAISWQRRPTRGAAPLALLMVAVAEWTVTLALEAAAVGVPAKVFWSKLQYIGLTNSPALLLLFALEFAHLDRWLTRRRLVVLWVIPVITLGLAMSNELHHLIWTSFTPSPVPGSNMIVYGHGAWFWIAVAYFYLVLCTASVILVWAALHSRHIHRRQAIVLLVGVPWPWLASVLYVFELGPLPGYDWTPVGFALTGAVLLLSIYHFRLFDLVPVAYDILVETMTDGLVVLDAHNHVVDANPAALQLLGADASLIGRTLDEVLATHPDLVAGLPDALEGKAELRLEGDSPRHLDLRLSPLHDRRGHLIGRLLVWRDVTQSKEAEAQVLEQQRALATVQERDRMSRELHDSLGQVLSYVSTQAHATRQLLEQGQTAAAAVHLARLGEVARETNLDVREFILGMRTTISPEQGFFAALTDYVQQFSRSSGLSATLSRSEDCTDDLLTPVAQMQVLCIIQEALSNVRKHAQARSVQVLVTRLGNKVAIVIADDGVGFDAEAEIAGPHNRFGLTIMRERAAEVSGQVDVRSVPGQGTQVVVTLPTHEQFIPGSLPPMRLLLVDDHPLILEGLKSLLTNHGVQVVGLAQSGEEAIEQVRELQPDVVLMDVQMPGLSGIEATRRIKAARPETRVVMLTMSAAETDLLAAVRAGASGYLLKSLHAGEFLAQLAQLARGQTPLAPDLAPHLLAEITRSPGSDTVSPEARLKAAGLSATQVEVLRLVAQGLTYQEVGDALYLSERTIRYHMGRVLVHLNLTKRAEAVAYASRIGLL